MLSFSLFLEQNMAMMAMMTMMTMWWVADPGLSGLITLFTASASHTQIVMTRMIMMVGRRIMMMVILKVVPHKI